MAFALLQATPSFSLGKCYEPDQFLLCHSVALN